jgi:hypothetical protein
MKSIQVDRFGIGAAMAVAANVNVKTNGWLLSAALLGLLVASAPSAAALRFEYKDWELVCDNTRTCRAAGYQEQSGDSEPVSMLITRAAGPRTGVHIQIKLETEGKAQPNDLVTMSLGNRVFSKLPLLKDWNAAQVQTTLPALFGAEAVDFKFQGEQRWILSLTGMKAVLLKMDEFQGRVGTIGALVAKGKKSEEGVLKPLLPLNIVIPKIPAAQKGDQALIAKIRAELDQSDCDKSAPENFEIERLSNSKMLLWNNGCYPGAYNSSDAYWLANDRPPYNPQPLSVDGGNGYHLGEISGIQKGRGLGDCLSESEWRWNGSEFILSKQLTTGMCRGFLGGAWVLPTVASSAKKSIKHK